MEIKRVAQLTEDEMNKLVEAGKLLKSLKMSADNNEFDIMSGDLEDLISALHLVCDDILIKKEI